MIVRDTSLSGCKLVVPERIIDQRGFFARTFDADLFEANGMAPAILQCSVSYNERRGTLRGLHWQAAPHEEAKLVRCVRGRVFDVAVDVRESSPTRHHWVGVELSEANREALYIPAGVAHGFLTLEPGSEVLYQMSVRFAPGSARGIRWDDPTIGIRWPEAPAVMSEADANLPRLA